MSDHVTGGQARELLAETTPGPWLALDYEQAWRSIGPIHGDSISEQGLGDGYLIASDEDVNLAASAPDLAQTVAWLYGREANLPNGIHSVRIRGDKDADIVYAVKGGTVVFDVDGGHRTVDEAEEFARAILAVVEEARHAEADA